MVRMVGEGRGNRKNREVGFILLNQTRKVTKGVWMGMENDGLNNLTDEAGRNFIIITLTVLFSYMHQSCF